jgi:DNA mismatch repair protein PMS2
MSGSGREELRLNTMHGTSKLEETISSVLGSAFLSGMSRISIDLPVDDSAMWTVEGLISKAPNLTARDGTVARNAQFFSINGRPVDLPKVSRTLSDAWRTFEGTSKKKPACVLQFTLPKNSFDVNLSPNKRQVLLTEEQKICDLVHAATLALWSSQRDGKFLPNELDIKHGTVEAASFVSDISPTRGRKVKRRLGFYNDFRSVKLQHDTETDQLQGSSNREASLRSPLPPTAITPSQKEQGQPGSATDASRTGETDMSPEQPLEPIISEEIQGDKPTDAERRQFMEVQERCRQRGNEDEIQTLDLAPITPQDNGDKDVDSPVRGESDGASSPPKESFVPLKNRSFEAKVTSTGDRAAKPSLQGPRVVSDGSDTAPPKKKTITMEVFGFRPVEKQRQTEDKKETDKVPASSTTSSSTSTQVSSTPSTRITRRAVSVSEKVASVDASQTRKRKSSDSRYEEQEPDASQEVEEEETVEWNSFQGTDAVIQASRKARLELRDRRKRLKLLKTERQRDETSSQTEEVDMTSASQAGDDDDKNKIVSLTKKDFEGMQVIGQFNLGFILAKCRKHNLWVLDQHACDEKYNFERLCANTVIHEQKLLAPMPLELSPSEEMCILDNREIFEQNGFRFEYSEDKPPRHRFALTSLPHSGARDGRKAVQFGKDDVRALCAVLGADGHSYSQDGGTGVDGNGMYGNNAVRRYAGLSQDGEKVMTRLPKAVAMFANRACRGSVMIGTALSKKEMETIVHRLANVEHPWNCPHGRPTLKHIKDMLGTEAKDERRTLNHTAGPTVVAMTEMTQPEDEEQQN